jgi:hypothetical protein
LCAGRLPPPPPPPMNQRPFAPPFLPHNLLPPPPPPPHGHAPQQIAMAQMAAAALAHTFNNSVNAKYEHRNHLKYKTYS